MLPSELLSDCARCAALCCVELAFDLTRHSVIGPWDALKSYGRFKRLFDRLVTLAFERRPDVIVCVDFSVFNHRFAEKMRWAT